MLALHVYLSDRKGCALSRMLDLTALVVQDPRICLPDHCKLLRTLHDSYNLFGARA